ncbi:hypothetical protein CDAR_565271 [Caerostris darwini]|uniref:Uncharacterized protein n=1 Tax=Caerostris darwini TaxID=1538125 RepID=A0AAV4TVP5_9ARAC|nr:hypothetical protein CDAR_565271 [Caerostris darwini]
MEKRSHEATECSCHKARTPTKQCQRMDGGIIKSKFLQARWSGVSSEAAASTCDLRTTFWQAWANVEVGATPVALAYHHVLVQRPHLLSEPLFPPGEHSFRLDYSPYPFPQRLRSDSRLQVRR